MGGRLNLGSKINTRFEYWENFPTSSLPPLLTCLPHSVTTSAQIKQNLTGAAKLPVQLLLIDQKLVIICDKNKNTASFVPLIDTTTN